ncbi:helix-turn-helix domain-containing protein [Streptomyces sp. NBC_01723]|uniref:helix-turn-helix domain-containing protein n=1 Tax=unclassified Streptomyces TaxID=2593676 RepID=UPI002785FE5B|nr:MULTISPECIES: helix-turn-helix domain-containing protein [unclassified Streptomyces]MDQ0408599.1 transcriptional regulator GlxA family with amidase domain [Streptomyces sp. DSM 40167]
MCHPGWRQAMCAAQRLRDLAQVRRVRDRIDRDSTRPLDVEALARAEGLPAGLLAARFREAYGLSPYAYVTVRRVERAMELLRQGELGTAQLARAVGCPCAQVLAARFAELAGMSVQDYRRRAAAGAGGLPWCAGRPAPPDSRAPARPA